MVDSVTTIGLNEVTFDLTHTMTVPPSATLTLGGVTKIPGTRIMKK